MSIRNICGMALAGFLGLAFVASLISHFSVSIPHQNLDKVLNGEASTAYEEKFDKELVHHSGAIHLWNSLGYVLFKEGKRGVLIGRDGWLFTDEEFFYPKNFSQNVFENKKYISETSQTLTGNGAKVLIVPIPSKSRIYSEKLGKYDFPDYWRSQYANLLDYLNEDNIAFIDLLSTFQEIKDKNIFLKTDTHWTPMGARVAALKISQKVEGNWPYLSWNPEKITTTKGDEIKHEGDLMRYTVNGYSADMFNLKTDQFHFWATTVEGEGSLFDNKMFPVVLVGTSFSANKLWNFDGFLKEFLGTDILNVSDEGLGPFETMQNYLDSNTYSKSKPKLIIWEIPERYLPVQYNLIESNN